LRQRVRPFPSEQDHLPVTLADNAGVVIEARVAAHQADELTRLKILVHCWHWSGVFCTRLKHGFKTKMRQKN
jgi:hypothetical protein